MAIRQLNPYLCFAGTAEKAIKLYESALGGKAEGIMRFGDAPESKAGPEDKNRVMHAVVHLGGGVIMVSDSMTNMPNVTESNVQVALDFDDAADMSQKFDALAVGGKIVMPLRDTFWGAKFGMLTDAFGIHWMFNYDRKAG